MSMKNPPHPGGLIRREIIDPLGLSVSTAAEILGVSRQALSLLLNERTDLSSASPAHRESIRSEDGPFDEDAARL